MHVFVESPRLGMQQHLFCNLLAWVRTGSVGFHGEIGSVSLPVFADFHEDDGNEFRGAGFVGDERGDSALRWRKPSTQHQEIRLRAIPP